MNGTLAQNIARTLMPALEQSQGFCGTYTQAGQGKPLTVVPTKPEWLSADEHGAQAELWKGIVFEVSTAQWASTGFGTPLLNDRLSVTLADGVPQIYALLPPRGKRPYEQDAVSGTYFLNMKLVSG